MGLIEGMLAKTGWFLATEAYHHTVRKIQQTDFLRYDPRYLLNCYCQDASPIGEGLPYIELERLLRPTWKEFLAAAEALRVRKREAPFQLAKSPPQDLSDFQAYALSRFKKEGRMAHDDGVVRLVSYCLEKKEMLVQKCYYSDGLRSNFAMDLRGHGTLGTSDMTLRDVLGLKYGRRLPPLSDRRLSNDVGIAVIVFYKSSSGDVIPYLPMRTKPGVVSETVGTTKKQAVFSSGGYHCTASGATQWMDQADSFDELFTGDMCRELEEEVGLARQDLVWIHPVALCREFLRGGKPQLFFAAYTNLPPEEINRRRWNAIQMQRARGKRQEVEDDALIVSEPSELYTQLWTHGTVEAVANMVYAQDCAALAEEAKQFD
jgi:predicted NUDIX family phosphoesterase